ncbi:MAG TPA: DNA translocase FtsK, partial [Candidatus Eremiobacteraceae bacterium]|nr:DNA translocase FtsK [Candidatus Eremiobacteraceae bacterium]
DDDGALGASFDPDAVGSGDQLYDQAVALVCRERKASTSFVQRHLQIGYNRAARIIERMETEGVVSAANHVGKREVLGRNIDEE